MRHQRPSSAYFGAVSFHCAGSSTGGRSYFTGCTHPATSSEPSASHLVTGGGRMVRNVRGGVGGGGARVRHLLLDLARRALLGEVAVGHQLEEHRHEEDGEEGRRQH